MFIYIMITAFITSLFTVLFFAVWSLRRMVYNCRTLLSLHSPTLLPGPTVVERVRELGLRSVYRMRRIHDCLHLRRKSPIVRCAGNGALVIVSARDRLCPVSWIRPRPLSALLFFVQCTSTVTRHLPVRHSSSVSSTSGR